MKKYCKDCHWFSKGYRAPLLPIWTWYDSCSHKNNMKRQDIGECSYPINMSTKSVVKVTGWLDGMVKYNKIPEEINKKHDCKDFAITPPKKRQWIKKKKLIERYGIDFIKYKYDYRDWGLGQPVEN